jgi:hypothetical protein
MNKEVNAITKMNWLITKSLTAEDPDVYDLWLKISAAAHLAYSTYCNDQSVPKEDIIQLGENIDKLDGLIDDNKPKTLGPDTSARGRAFVEAMNEGINEYRDGLQRTREARYQAMIEEQEIIDGPSRGRGGR